MKRKTFIKQIMALGVSRNTATAAADAASRAEIPLHETACRIQTMHCMYVGPMAPVKQWRKQLDKILYAQARMTPRRIRPLAKKSHQGGLRAQFAVIDELHQAYCGGGGE